MLVHPCFAPPHLARAASSLVRGGVLPTCHLVLWLTFLCFIPPARTASSLVQGGVLPTCSFILWLLFFCFIPSCSYSLEPSARQCVAHMPLHSVASFFHPHLACTASSLVRGSVLPTHRFVLRLLFLCFTPHLVHTALSLVRGSVLPTRCFVLQLLFLCFTPPSCLYSLEPSARRCVAHMPLSFYMFAHALSPAIDTVGSVGIEFVRNYYIVISKLVPVVMKIQICIIGLRLKIRNNSE